MFQTLLFTHLPASVPETLVGGELSMSSRHI